MQIALVCPCRLARCRRKAFSVRRKRVARWRGSGRRRARVRLRPPAVNDENASTHPAAAPLCRILLWRCAALLPALASSGSDVNGNPRCTTLTSLAPFSTAAEVTGTRHTQGHGEWRRAHCRVCQHARPAVCGRYRHARAGGRGRGRSGLAGIMPLFSQSCGAARVCVGRAGTRPAFCGCDGQVC